MIDFDFDPYAPEKVSPEKFLEILAEREADVESSRFVPPKLGERGFGHFEVKWKSLQFPRGR